MCVCVCVCVCLQSRELKSINLDCQGQLVKLVLHQNHLNRLNLFNQVRTHTHTHAHIHRENLPVKSKRTTNCGSSANE